MGKFQVIEDFIIYSFKTDKIFFCYGLVCLWKYLKQTKIGGITSFSLERDNNEGVWGFFELLTWDWGFRFLGLINLLNLNCYCELDQTDEEVSVVVKFFCCELVVHGNDEGEQLFQ